MLHEFFTLDEVAERFRVSRRTLQDFLRDHPYYRNLGRRKLFTEADITRLYEALPCPSSSTESEEAPTGTSAAPSEASLWTRAVELLKDQQRRRSALNLSGNASRQASSAERQPQPSSHRP